MSEDPLWLEEILAEFQKRMHDEVRNVVRRLIASGMLELARHRDEGDAGLNVDFSIATEDDLFWPDEGDDKLDHWIVKKMPLRDLVAQSIAHGGFYDPEDPDDKRQMDREEQFLRTMLELIDAYEKDTAA